MLISDILFTCSNIICSALEYPRCTDTDTIHTDSDCGSEGWSFTLFIAWNLLSMVGPYLMEKLWNNN